MVSAQPDEGQSCPECLKAIRNPQPSHTFGYRTDLVLSAVAVIVRRIIEGGQRRPPFGGPVMLLKPSYFAPLLAAAGAA
jgi:hypothetical protein